MAKPLDKKIEKFINKLKKVEGIKYTCALDFMTDIPPAFRCGFENYKKNPPQILGKRYTITIDVGYTENIPGVK